MGFGHALALGERRILGRREEANEICRWRCWSRSWRSSTRRTPGLDIDALRDRGARAGSTRWKRPEQRDDRRDALQRLLNYIVPDYVHVLADGRIVRSGGKELALELEAKGYDWLLEEAVA
jgi:Fe-S cluster assembly ATP-binding protein